MEKIKDWLNHPVYTMNYWAYVCLVSGALWVGMMVMFLAVTYSVINWEMAQQKVALTIVMLAFGFIMFSASYFGTKKTK